VPARRRSSRMAHGTQNRRKLIWAQRTAALNMTANNQWFVVDLLSEYKAATGASSVGVTVMRTHLKVVPRSPSANDTFWLGLRVDDLDQVTGAVTTNALVANPHDNPYVDWMWSEKFQIDQSNFAGRAGGAYAGAVLDVRSKRRMEEVQEAYLLTVYQDTVGTVAKEYDVFCRTLLALP